jgi:aconitase B
MLAAYRQHAAERAALGIPPLPLDAKQTAELIELIKAPPAGEEAFLLDLLTTACRRAWTTPPRSRPASWPPWRTVT